jgi:Cu/Ag efflux pump CusA
VNRVAAIIGLGVIAFAVTLAVYIGKNLSNEAMSVLIGAACGIGAMVPAFIVAVLALLRRREREEMNAARNMSQPSVYPPVIVVSPPAVSAPQSGQSYIPSPSSATPRQFTVIGDDSLDVHT